MLFIVIFRYNRQKMMIKLFLFDRFSRGRCLCERIDGALYLAADNPAN